MKLNLRHPWWAHSPALLCWAAMTALLALAQMPERVPVHFDWSGKADRWGAPWELWLVFAGIPLLFIAGSFLLDELYCRFERGKQFNFLSAFDEGLVGFFLGLELATLPLLSSPEPVLKGELPLGIGAAIALAALALGLERLRKPSPCPATPGKEELQELSKDELESFGEGRRWLHWEAQNPLYLRLTLAALLALPALMLMDRGLPRLIPLAMLCIVLPVFVLFYGGMRVSVTPERFAIRFGVFGAPLLWLPLKSIVASEAVSFNPLGDFGGWGIRYSSKLGWGYFLSGAKGVRLETASGRRFIIGSDDAGKLAAVCQAALKSSGRA